MSPASVILPREIPQHTETSGAWLQAQGSFNLQKLSQDVKNKNTKLKLLSQQF